MGKKSKRQKKKTPKPQQEAMAAPSVPAPESLFAPSPAQIATEYYASSGIFTANAAKDPKCLHGAPPDNGTIIEPKSGVPLWFVRRLAVEKMMALYDTVLLAEVAQEQWYPITTVFMEEWMAFNVIDELIVKAMYAKAVEYALNDQGAKEVIALNSAINLKFFVQVGPEKWKEGNHALAKKNRKEVRNYPWIVEMHKVCHKVRVNGFIATLDKEIPCDCLHERKEATKHIPKHVFCSNLDCDKFDDVEVLQRCSGCSRVFYCNEQCQLAHWPEHKVLCKAIAHKKK